MVDIHELFSEQEYRIYQNVDAQLKRMAAKETGCTSNEQDYEEMVKMLQVMVAHGNEYIAKIEQVSKQVLVYAAVGNRVGFTPGYQTISYKEYEDQCRSYLTFVDVFGKKRISSCEEALERVHDEPYDTTYIMKYQGEVFYLRSQIFGEGPNLYVVVTDVTDLVKTEYERAEKLKKANAIQTDFLSRMSHDMRTPLGAVISVSEFGVNESEDPRLRGYFRQIKASSTYLISIMNDILDVQRLRNHTIVLDNKVFELKQLNEIIAEMVGPKATQKGIKLTLEEHIGRDE